MKKRFAIALSMAILIAVPVTASAQAPVYNLTALPGLGGAQDQPMKITDDGRVVGTAQLATGESRAYIWSPAAGIRDLGTLGGATSAANGITANGMVFGYSEVAGSYRGHAFIWTAAGGMVDLGAPAESYSFAVAANNAGEVAGYTQSDRYDHRAVVWDAAHQMIELSSEDSKAVAINSRGQVVGYRALAGGGGGAFVWDAANGMRDLPPLSPGASCDATAINDSGVIVGSCYVAGRSHAVVWPATGVTDLGGLGGSDSRALAINAAGQVIGVADLAWRACYYCSYASHAFLWDAASGLRDLTPHDANSYPYAINDSGQVVGKAAELYGFGPAFVWDANYGMQPLTVAGARYGTATSINNTGQIAGMLDSAGRIVGFISSDKAPAPFAVDAGADRQFTSNQFGELAIELHGEGRP